MRAFIMIMALLLTSGTFAACDSDENGDVTNNNDTTENFENMKLKITVGSRTLTATLEDNPTARDFAALLPMSVDLTDYARTEKVFDLPGGKRLSTQDAPAGMDPDIGDITYFLPWGNIAIFYKDFGYAGGLIKIGHIDDGIEALQVSGSISNVKFELVKK